MKMTTKILAGTTILGALVVVFDYTLKFSGLKIPFPLFPRIKFDFTGIPIVLSLLLFGLIPGVITSAVAFFAILVRSGEFVGPSMKALAEFSTIFGMAIGIRLFKNSEKLRKPVSFLLGCIMRILTMFLANLLIQPLYYGMSFMEALLLSPYIGAFNLVQGFLSMFGGYLIYEAIRRRFPSLSEKNLGIWQLP